LRVKVRDVAVWVVAWLGYGGRGRRRASGVAANGIRRRGRPAHEDVPRGTNQRAYGRHAQGTRDDAWTAGYNEASACVYRQGGRGRCGSGMTASRAPSFQRVLAPKQSGVALFSRVFLKISQPKWTKAQIAKL
jgi:hypothetical protein